MGIVPSFDLLVMLFLHPRMLLTSFQAHCSLMLSLLSAKCPKAFLGEHSLAIRSPASVISGTLFSQVQDCASVLELHKAPVDIHLACGVLSGQQLCTQACEPIVHPQGILSPPPCC